MEEKTICYLHSHGLKLVKNEKTYMLINSNDYVRTFDLSKKSWKSDGEAKYLKETTKIKIIDELRAWARNRTEVAEFITWYDGRTFEEEGEEKPSPKAEAKTEVVVLDNSEVVNQLKELTSMLKAQSQRNPFEQAMLEGIIEKGKELATEELRVELTSHLKSFVEKSYGVLPKVIEIKQGDSRKEMQGNFHNLFDKIIKVVSAKIPLMLVGPAGSGKNHTLEQVAEALSLDFYFSNAITQEYKLTGFIDAHGKFQETEFFKAFSKGGLFFFDEIDASSPESLIVVNAALANGYFDFPNGRINAHENFRVVAAANTFGHGADMIYIGRNQLDAATLDRFAVMTFEYDAEIEKALAFDTDLYDFIFDLRRAINRRGLRYVISMRATINATKMLNADMDKLTIVKSVITKAMSKDDVNSIINELKIDNEWTKLLRKV